jgi:hypothetical protein
MQQPKLLSIKMEKISSVVDPMSNLDNEINQMKQKKKRRKYIENMIPELWELGSDKGFYTEVKKTDVSDSDTSDKERGKSNKQKGSKKKKRKTKECNSSSNKRKANGKKKISIKIENNSDIPNLIDEEDEEDEEESSNIGPSVKESFYFINKVNEERDEKNNKQQTNEVNNTQQQQQQPVSVITKIEAKMRKQSNKMEATFEQCTKSDIRPLEDWISNYYYQPNKTQQMINDEISNSITAEINYKILGPSSETSSTDSNIQSFVEMTEELKKKNAVKHQQQQNVTEGKISSQSTQTPAVPQKYKKPSASQRKIDEKKKQEQKLLESSSENISIIKQEELEIVKKEESPQNIPIKKRLFYENDDLRDQPFQLSPVEYEIIRKLELEELKKDRNYRDIGRNYIHKTNLEPPDLPVCKPSYCRKMMREPLGEQYGERRCANESKCMAMIMATLYPDSLDNFVPEDAFIMMEFLFPEQHEAYKATSVLPPIRQDCILCNRHKTTLRHYMYQKRNEEPKELIQDHQNTVATPPLNGGMESSGPIERDAYNIDKCIYPETSSKQVFTGITRPIVKFSPNNYVYDTTKVLVSNESTKDKATIELKCMKEINMDFH